MLTELALGVAEILGAAVLIAGVLSALALVFGRGGE